LSILITTPAPRAVEVELGPVIAGGVAVMWPVLFKRLVRQTRCHIIERGKDVAAFDQRVNSLWFRASLILAVAIGLALIIDGLTQ
jgi:hypothetical protein